MYIYQEKVLPYTHVYIPGKGPTLYTCVLEQRGYIWAGMRPALHTCVLEQNEKRRFCVLQMLSDAPFVRQHQHVLFVVAPES
jgi:hypothetical protein